MVMRLVGDDSQLEPDQESESSGETEDASLSSATCLAMEHRCSGGDF